MKNGINDFLESQKPDRARAERTIMRFAAEVVTQEKETRYINNKPWYQTVTNLIISPFMDSNRGMSFAVVVLVAVIILGGIGFFMNLIRPVNRNARNTPTVTVTPTQASSDLDQISKQIDQTAADLDALDKEMNDMEASLSTSEIDAQLTQLDAVK